MSTRELWLEGRATAADERNLYVQGWITACEYEFGPHSDHSDCDRMLDEMRSTDDALGWIADQYNRAAQEEYLGRPLFPNEY